MENNYEKIYKENNYYKVKGYINIFESREEAELSLRSFKVYEAERNTEINKLYTDILSCKHLSDSFRSMMCKHISEYAKLENISCEFDRNPTMQLNRKILCNELYYK